MSRLTELISHQIGIRVHLKEEEMTLELVHELFQQVARCSSMRKQEVRESAVGLEACGWRELRQPWLRVLRRQHTIGILWPWPIVAFSATVLCAVRRGVGDVDDYARISLPSEGQRLL